ncbi:MAG: hypothetical protein MZV63_02265 [Marinilabiliales bacterium]|nr:hypothetical protein [Marinilabiliales bacterium]
MSAPRRSGRPIASSGQGRSCRCCHRVKVGRKTLSQMMSKLHPERTSRQHEEEPLRADEEETRMDDVDDFYRPPVDVPKTSSLSMSSARDSKPASD